MLVVSAISLIVILTVKEIIAVNHRLSRIANFLYLPVLPLMVLFGIAVFDNINQIPSLTG